MNEIERYLAAAAGQAAVSVGEDISLAVDLLMAHDVSAPLALEQFAEIGVSRVFDPGKIVLILDHNYPAPNSEARTAHRAMHEFAVASISAFLKKARASTGYARNLREAKVYGTDRNGGRVPLSRSLSADQAQS